MKKKPSYAQLVGATRLFVALQLLVLVYVGNALVGFPVDWWVPVWALFTVDALAYNLGAAWGIGAGKSQLVAAQEFGKLTTTETVGEHSVTTERSHNG